MSTVYGRDGMEVLRNASHADDRSNVPMFDVCYKAYDKQTGTHKQAQEYSVVPAQYQDIVDEDGEVIPAIYVRNKNHGGVHPLYITGLVAVARSEHPLTGKERSGDVSDLFYVTQDMVDAGWEGDTKPVRVPNSRFLSRKAEDIRRKKILSD